MKAPLILVHDVGTTSSKSCLYRLDDRLELVETAFEEYPLYVMHLYGDNSLDRLLQEGIEAGAGSAVAAPSPDPQWACTVFAVLNGEGDRLLGRNFDWFNR